MLEAIILDLFGWFFMMYSNLYQFFTSDAMQSINFLPVMQCKVMIKTKLNDQHKKIIVSSLYRSLSQNSDDSKAF